MSSEFAILTDSTCIVCQSGAATGAWQLCPECRRRACRAIGAAAGGDGPDLLHGLSHAAALTAAVGRPLLPEVPAAIRGSYTFVGAGGRQGRWPGRSSLRA